MGFIYIVAESYGNWLYEAWIIDRVFNHEKDAKEYIKSKDEDLQIIKKLLR